MKNIVTLKWHGDALTRDVRRAAERGVKAAALHLKEKLQINIGVVGPPRSLPGDFPHVDTGELQDSAVAIADAKNLSWRVVMTAPHATFLEFGTSTMAPRPFGRRTMEEEKDTLSQIIVSHIKPATGKYS